LSAEWPGNIQRVKTSNGAKLKQKKAGAIKRRPSLG
jgi:hypothetical protein